MLCCDGDRDGDDEDAQNEYGVSSASEFTHFSSLLCMLKNFEERIVSDR